MNLCSLASWTNLLPPLHLPSFHLTLANVALRSGLRSGGVQQAETVKHRRGRNTTSSAEENSRSRARGKKPTAPWEDRTVRRLKMRSVSWEQNLTICSGSPTKDVSRSPFFPVAITHTRFLGGLMEVLGAHHCGMWTRRAGRHHSLIHWPAPLLGSFAFCLIRQRSWENLQCETLVGGCAVCR